MKGNVEIKNKDPLCCCCVVGAFDPAVVKCHTCIQRWKRSVHFLLLRSHGFIFIYPKPTQERSGQTYVLGGLGQISREMYTNSHTSSWVYAVRLQVFFFIYFFDSTVWENVERWNINGWQKDPQTQKCLNWKCLEFASLHLPGISLQRRSLEEYDT